MSFNKYNIGNITGDGNTINNGDMQQFFYPVIKPKEGIMCNLLNNIANMISDREIHPEFGDNLPYSITEKIIFNEIQIYKDYQEDYDDSLYIIEGRLRTIEDSSTGNIKPQVFRYVRGFFRKIKSENSDLKSDQIIKLIEQSIILDLKDYYHQILSPEDLSHVQYVVYYVFAACQIFDKPTKDFMNSRNADT